MSSPVLKAVTLVAASIALAACGGDAPQPAPAASKPAAPPAQAQPAGGDTSSLRAADAVGYDGEALQRSVDRMREDAAERAQEAEEAAREAGGP